MARIDIKPGESHDTTIYDIVGTVAVDDIITVMHGVRERRDAANALLDISGAELCHLDGDEIDRTIREARTASLAGTEGRTAIVAPADASLKILKLCAAISCGPAAAPGSFHFVANRDDAMAWLGRKC